MNNLSQWLVCDFWQFQKEYKYYNSENRKFYTTMDVDIIENESYFLKTQVHAEGETSASCELNMYFLTVEVLTAMRLLDLT
jgi:hypothetical protein